MDFHIEMIISLSAVLAAVCKFDDSSIRPLPYTTGGMLNTIGSQQAAVVVQTNLNPKPSATSAGKVREAVMCPEREPEVCCL